MKRCGLMIVFLALALLFVGCGKQNAFAVVPTETAPAVTVETPPPVDAGLFTYNDSLEVSHEEITFSDEGVESVKTEMRLTEEEWQTLMVLLAPYESTMDSTNVLKSDFYSSYTIKKSGKALAWIDAAGNYPEQGEDLSYMFVWEYTGGVVKRYGTFIDKAVLEYLDNLKG